MFVGKAGDESLNCLWTWRALTLDHHLKDELLQHGAKRWAGGGTFTTIPLLAFFFFFFKGKSKNSSVPWRTSCILLPAGTGLCIPGK